MPARRARTASRSSDCSTIIVLLLMANPPSSIHYSLHVLKLAIE
jgi:hypothetical protein